MKGYPTSELSETLPDNEAEEERYQSAGQRLLLDEGFQSFQRIRSLCIGGRKGHVEPRGA